MGVRYGNPRRGRGIALGALGVVLLVFFSGVFMLGRHGAHWGEIYEEVVHPFAKHPGAVPSKEVVMKTPEPIASATTAGNKIKPSPAAATDGLSQLERTYTPTREMVQKIAENGMLIVTWANWHYQDFVRTWLSHIKAVGVTGYIVGAMDDHLLQVLIDQKVNTFSMKSGLTLGDFGWGSGTFAKMGREKIKLIRVFLQLGVDVIISDVDVLWLRNPLPYFAQYPDADILTSSDHLRNTVSNYDLELWPQAASAANIGIMLFRNQSMEFVNRWIDIIEKDANVWDQNAFNDLFRIGVRELPDNKQHLFLGYNGKLKMGILPVSVFGSGHTFFTQRMWQTLKLEPYALHATFQFSGTPGKRHRMREFMLFDDPPEYYDHSVGFVTFKMDGLESLLKAAGPNTGNMDLANVQGHFKLMNHQILRIRTALAISSILGRALVVPQLWCGLDRWWAPHAGRIPGSDFELPFPCPMDHVFDLEGGWSRGLPADTYGPHIDFREYSFLNNSKLPAAVRDSKVIIEICPSGTAGCSDGITPPVLQDGKLKVQEGLTSEKLISALAPAKVYKVLEFSTMAGAFKNFTDPVDWTKFFGRVKGYTSIWCCVNAHPGHIHYDPWFDIPHTDKFNRQWEEWKPVTGP
ncbi:nucleotide-diphospho-sugar transferase-domain-containing protein [Haematococcus lacustris]